MTSPAPPEPAPPEPAPPEPAPPEPANVVATQPVAGERRGLRLLGWVATATAVAMYVSYLAQIQLNLHGHKGSAIQPLATAVNCTLWVIYGLGKRARDWPVALANAPGVLLGALTFATAL